MYHPEAPSGATAPLTLLTLGELLKLDLPEREQLLAPWLLQRHLNMTYAPTGIGKSMFAMSVALAIAGGGMYLGWKASKPRSVLIVDGEMDILDLKERATMLIPTISEIDAKVAWRNLTILAHQAQKPGVQFPDLANERGREAILRTAMQLGAELVVLDNFSTLVTVEEENKASSFNPVITLMQELKQHGVACMLIHHSRKGDGGVNSYRGTSKMGVIFNSILELNHPDGIRSTNGAAFELNWEKFRGRRDGTICPLRVCLEDGEDGSPEWKYEVTEDGRMGELIHRLRTLEYSNQRDLGNSMGLEAYQVTRIKQRAIKWGLITKDEWDECLKLSPEGAFDDAESPDF